MSCIGLEAGRDYELCNPNSDPRYNDYVAFYLERTARKGITPEHARETLRTRRTVIAAVMLIISFALLFLINLIQTWARRRFGYGS